jgi:hypothetical protein
MKFILVVVVILSDSVGAAPSITTAEFNSESACRRAAEDIDATLSKLQSNTLSTARCYHKGD